MFYQAIDDQKLKIKPAKLMIKCGIKFELILEKEWGKRRKIVEGTSSNLVELRNG